MGHATLADGQYKLWCELPSGNGPFGADKKNFTCDRSMSESLRMYRAPGTKIVHSAPAAKAEPLHTYDICERVDLRAHALWYLLLVVVPVVMVMARFHGGDGGDGRWRA